MDAELKAAVRLQAMVDIARLSSIPLPRLWVV